MEIFDFNGSWDHLCGVITQEEEEHGYEAIIKALMKAMTDIINWLVNIAETFTDILKHYDFQMAAAKFVKSMLQRTTLKSFPIELALERGLTILLQWCLFLRNISFDIEWIAS